ncbi:MAG: hypothetical protein OEM84_07400 [Acidimicrobiia bacterium]|nr:hypothetical protein [Acidimicrobiia bacterium]
MDHAGPDRVDGADGVPGDGKRGTPGRGRLSGLHLPGGQYATITSPIPLAAGVFW